MSVFQPIKLDKQSAIKGSQTGGRITTPTKDVFSLKRVEFIQNQNGTKLVELDLVGDSGGSTTTCIYYENSSGKEVSGLNTLNAIMCCAKVSTLTPQQGQVTKYDFDSQQDITTNGVVGTELINKKVGLLVYPDYYNKDNGDVAYAIRVFTAYNEGTELTADEMYAGEKEPQALGDLVTKMIARSDRTKVQAESLAQNHTMQPMTSVPVNSGTQQPAIMDDDLPF